MIKQRGLTLIELLVGLVLTSILVAGICGLFLQMQKSNRVQRALSTMIDESGYVQEVLQKEIRRTGGLRSRSDKNGTDDDIFLPHTNVLNSGLDFTSGEYIKGNTTTSSDALILRYQLVNDADLGSNPESNGSSPCTQNVLLDSGEDPQTTEHTVSVYLFLSARTLSCVAQRTVQDRKNGVLESCAKNCVTPGSTTDFTANGTPVELISNVEKFIVTYGVDSDSTNGADYYARANDIASDKWKDVISVRLSAVVRSNEDYLTNAVSSYNLEGTSFTPTDHHLYRVFTTTIALRNQITG